MKHHFYILRHTDLPKDYYTIGIEADTKYSSVCNKPYYHVLFYRGVSSNRPRLLHRLEELLFKNYSPITHTDNKFHFRIRYDQLIELVNLEFDLLKYKCRCKEFCTSSE